jgi:hypothetical protein
MPAPPPDALVEAISREHIASLARLYDKFAHALDPFSAESDQAERAFHQEIADRYDRLALLLPALSMSSPRGLSLFQKLENSFLTPLDNVRAPP